jgi:5'(3')-deoxyribonucleotidase
MSTVSFDEAMKSWVYIKQMKGLKDVKQLQIETWQIEQELQKRNDQIRELKNQLETYNHGYVVHKLETIFKTLMETSDWRTAVKDIILLTQDQPGLVELIRTETIRHMEAIDLTALVMGALKD